MNNDDVTVQLAPKNRLNQASKQAAINTRNCGFTTEITLNMKRDL